MMKKLILIILLVIMHSCSSSKGLIINGKEVNTKLNKEYRASNESTIGIFTKEEYESMKESIQEALDTIIPDGKSILINYEQSGRNCLIAAAESSSVSIVADNGKRISNRMSKEYNATDFFLYNENTFFKNIYESKSYYKINPGFFRKIVFTKDNNCSGFFIMKPNGEFIVYYGEDYFTEVKRFFNSTLTIVENK